MTTAALIVAAGSGRRAGENLPKQYTWLGAKTILMHTLEKFVNHRLVDQVLVVIGKGHENLFKDTIRDFGCEIAYCIGGDTRQKSVFAGLQHLAASPPDKVLIHDGARPFVSSGLIDRVIHSLDSHKAVLPALGLSDTIKRVEHDRSLKTIDRDTLFRAQTPQGFNFKEILKAHQQADLEQNYTFSDDSSIAEWVNMDVSVVEGAPENFKITTPEDIERARQLHHPAIPDIRCGEGYDVHRLGPGDHVILCGIKIPHTQSLIGHSDADVALHALTDALLGSIAAGDIGSHFPASDPRWHGQSSDMFLDHACKLIAARHGIILNIDVTLICEHPKIGPLRDQMRQNIAGITRTDVSRISVKATTTEGLGFTGRTEGIAARASVSVFLGVTAR